MSQWCWVGVVPCRSGRKASLRGAQRARPGQCHCPSPHADLRASPGRIVLGRRTWAPASPLGFKPQSGEDSGSLAQRRERLAGTALGEGPRGERGGGARRGSAQGSPAPTCCAARRDAVSGNRLPLTQAAEGFPWETVNRAGRLSRQARGPCAHAPAPSQPGRMPSSSPRDGSPGALPACPPGSASPDGPGVRDGANRYKGPK